MKGPTAKAGSQVRRGSGERATCRRKWARRPPPAVQKSGKHPECGSVSERTQPEPPHHAGAAAPGRAECSSAASCAPRGRASARPGVRLTRGHDPFLHHATTGWELCFNFCRLKQTDGNSQAPKKQRPPAGDRSHLPLPGPGVRAALTCSPCRRHCCPHAVSQNGALP